jgi:hydrogenase-1 operon protein HyaF
MNERVVGMSVENTKSSLRRDDMQVASDFAIPVTAPYAEPLASINTSKDVSQTTRVQRPIFWMRPATPPSIISAQPGATALAIVSELEVCATRFAATGDIASIDLRFLKSMPEERATLASMLGKGEVSIVVEAIGRTEIQETTVPCVWWITHQNSEGETVGESIEITDIPDLIVGDREAVAHGLEALRATVSFRARSFHEVVPFPDTRYAT